MAGKHCKGRELRIRRPVRQEGSNYEILLSFIVLVCVYVCFNIRGMHGNNGSEVGKDIQQRVLGRTLCCPYVA